MCSYGNNFFYFLHLLRTNRLTYETCGVSIKSGDNFVERIKPLAALTQRPGCKGDLGMFGGVFDVRAAGYQDPLLVSGTDGVGTKLKVCNYFLVLGQRL